MDSVKPDVFAKLYKVSADANLRNEALLALASSKSERAPQLLLGFWNDLNATQRKPALAALTSNKNGASATVQAVKSGVMAKEDLDASTLDKLHTLLGDDKEVVALMEQMSSLLQPVVRFEGKPDTYVSTKYKLAGPFTVECWLKLDPAINNEDGILAAPGQLDMNFHDGHFRVWVAGGQHDIVIARRKTVPDVWTHYAVTRDAQGVFRIYINGELDATSAGRNTNAFERLDVGRTIPKNGAMAGWMNEFRVWNMARTGEQILADFDRTYRGEAGIEETGSRRSGLVSLLTGAQWPALHGTVKIQRTMDAPALLDSAAANTLAEKFAKFRSLAAMNGDATRGEQLFTTTCLVCHQAGGRGGGFAPNLDGSGLRSMDNLLRAILTPSAAVEAGYRSFRVETKDGEIQDGFLASEDASGVVLRQPNVEPLKIPAARIKRAAFRNVSIMPDGLLEGMDPQQVKDLFAYLKTMK
jgi:putative heme-binding domain-containing protein